MRGLGLFKEERQALKAVTERGDWIWRLDRGDSGRLDPLIKITVRPGGRELLPRFQRCHCFLYLYLGLADSGVHCLLANQIGVKQV